MTKNVPKWRYVEISYKLPEDAENADYRWRAIVTEAASPREAIENAVADVHYAHPEAIEVEEFMTRTITEEKAVWITERMRAKNWIGWFEEEGTRA